MYLYIMDVQLSTLPGHKVYTLTNHFIRYTCVITGR